MNYNTNFIKGVINALKTNVDNMIAIFEGDTVVRDNTIELLAFEDKLEV
jgi:hypothetical protein